MRGSGRADEGPARGFRAPGWQCGRHHLEPPGRPLVMGILNLTPDSFYPESRVDAPDSALRLALEMTAAGADLMDLGAESSRPGSEPVGATEEQKRLLPTLRLLRRQTDIPITVDTTSAETAAAALAEGADGINDISAGTADPALPALAGRQGCGLVLMHRLGPSRSMQEDPRYDDVVRTVAAFLKSQAEAAEAAGVLRDAIVVDPGIGFGKTLAHNLELLAHLDTIRGARPLLVGASRKSFIGMLCGAPVSERLGGSLAALAAAYQAGATVVRVHDVAASVQFLDTLAAISEAARART